jgi:hypothetical protein
VGRERERAEQHEPVAAQLEVAARAGEQVEPERRDAGGSPCDARYPLSQEERPEQRREDDEQAGDEAGVRGRRLLQP